MPGIVMWGDNTDRPNYGCRATSVALRTLLQEIGTVRSFHSTFDEAIPERRSRRRVRTFDKVGDWGSLVGIRGRDKWTSDSPTTTLARLRAASRWMPKVAEVLAAISRADNFVVNGEGSVIFTTPPRNDLHIMMALVTHAAEVGVPTHFVNSGISPCPSSGQNQETIKHTLDVLSSCESLFLREPISFEYLQSLGYKGENAKVVPDALFAWKEFYGSDISKSIPPSALVAFGHDHELAGMRRSQVGELERGKYVCVSGASVPPGESRVHWQREFADLVAQIKVEMKLPVVLLVPDPGDGFLNEVGKITNCPVISPRANLVGVASILGNAAVFISGRYHPSILASLSGTPLIMFGSNSHKGEGLGRLLGEGLVGYVEHVGSERFRYSVMDSLWELMGNEKLRPQILDRVGSFSEEVIRTYSLLGNQSS